jgi:hypothetical protein
LAAKIGAIVRSNSVSASGAAAQLVADRMATNNTSGSK